MSRLHRAVAWGGLLSALSIGASTAPLACNPGPAALLRAKKIENRSELVGGPVQAATVGDFLLENDQIRIAILGSRSSPAPGLFGGSIVDADRRRPVEGFEGGLGHDRFSEMFPIANLLVPNPTFVDVKVLADGSDGKEAIVRVDGDGDFLYQALAILRDQKPVLKTIFPNVRTSLHFTTDYILHPGDRHVLIRTEVRIKDDDTPPSCPSLGGCTTKCDHGFKQDVNGCLVCECSDVLTLDPFTGPESVFGGILGDTPTVMDPPPVNKAGIIAGDFVFFGNQNDVFAPGVGFDEDEAVQGAANVGRNTFTSPLTYEYVAAAGRDISYGYFTGQPGKTVDVPIFASAATAFLTGKKNCAFDPSDDATCDADRAFTYERYFVIGDGDIATVTEEMDRIVGRKDGKLTGHVTWAETGEAVPQAQILVFSDPDPSKKLTTIDDLAAANRAARGDVGVVNSIYADVGIKQVPDGSFSGSLPGGDYVIVALDPTGQAVSSPARVRVRPGESTDVGMALPGVAFVDYRVTSPSGDLIPAKIGFVAVDDAGHPLDGDGRRRVYAGDSRFNDGIRLQEITAEGTGHVRIEPGRYRVFVSRGPEWSAFVEDVDLKEGQVHRLDATLDHQVDTTGWMSIDMHLHSAPSFDSGMPVPKRVMAVAAEGLDIGVSTDHEVETDYTPVIHDLHLEKQLKSFVSAEVTTLEYGHYIGFPMTYDNLDVPRHGAPDWSCLSAGGIIDAIRARGDGMKPFTIVAHPRDGFFGFIDQSGVDTFDLTRHLSTLTNSNPVFRTATCDFDAMEISGAKRLDLVRTPTVAEVVDWTHCKGRLNASTDEPSLLAACPEMPQGTLEACRATETFDFCKRRNRSRLAFYFTKRILERTESEQAFGFDFQGEQKDSQAICDLNAIGDHALPDDLKDQPCAYRAGQVDDFFRYLEYGFTPTQVASSDSHDGQKEPGSPRTYFQSPTDSPSAIDAKTVVDSLRAGHAIASYGPFIRASIDGKTFGEITSAQKGGKKELDLLVQTPDWFGVDRVEVYMNGHIIRVIGNDKGPKVIDDVKGKVTFDVPDRDSWVVVAAMGLDDQNQMRPMILDIPYGEVQLSALAAGAFADVPVVNTILKAAPTIPDWSPIIPYAITNPIYLDVDGNGRYDAPNGPPPFCSRPCKEDSECPMGQLCLEIEHVCGISIDGKCDIPRVAPGAD